ncbi:uncharacterized protein CELE_C34C12.9 [Caenorhabditis elegans]|uniref:Uncharacterized protein n=1 Tax=Caenorhabditis elegans TaxID=6239 RepID=Q7YX95_CAEEL|nr:Uncharacterized protein CELE_C34C12.9 [Caenorhabditis elegans]CAE17681.1 Uncharacterized protein CELE_C34C12.9 [Caenorhabditis elegans]|eukprot:NP_001021196.1 Uncharacterized protein CELE_C34C12.9 [Caenorhabditis elegans]
MQNESSQDASVPPKIPPRNHPIHLRNRLKLQYIEQALSPDMESHADDVAPCHSRKASSVGFVEIDELLKFQDDYKVRSSTGFYSSLRNLFSTGNPSTTTTISSIPESHINPMFANHEKCSISRSFTHLPYPPKKKRKSHLRRVFSCFSIFKH